MLQGRYWLLVTKGYWKSQAVTGSYRGLKGNTRGYKVLQGVTMDYKGFQGATGG